MHGKSQDGNASYNIAQIDLSPTFFAEHCWGLAVF